MNTYALRALVVGLFLTGYLAACGKEGSPSAEYLGSRAGAAASYAQLFGSPEGFDMEALTDADRQDVLEALAPGTLAIRRAVADAAHWEAADEAVRELLAAADYHAARPYLGQAAAKAMLEHRLLQAPPSPEQQAAVAFYAELLLEGRSPEAPLVLKALESLDGYWSASRRAAAAQQAATAAQVALQRRFECEGCGDEEIRARLPEGSLETQRAHILSIQDAISHLRTLEAPASS